MEYPFTLTEESQERLRRGEIITIELNRYQSIKIMDANVEVYTVEELVRKLKALEAYDDGSLDDLDWPGVDSKQDSDVESA